MGRYASSRNYGYGKQLAHAGKTALRDYYGQGHHGTVATHVERWTQFTSWARELGIRDLSKADNRELATAYAQHVQGQVEAGEISVSSAQNRISTVNVVFAALRGDRHVQISPSAYAGARSAVRTESPAGLSRAAAVLELARAFGVRREEAVKANLDRWAREANRHGAINVIDGTKGGRDAPRWIPVGETQRQALASALAARPDGSQNLIAPHERYVAVAINRNSGLNQAREILQQHGLPGYHDARAAYACERYTQITGYPAPAVVGERLASKALDRQARATISAELGHGRLDVLTSYVGSSR